MITRKGKEFHIGDWIYNTNGVFEITEIHASMNKVYGKEVVMSDEDPDMYGLEGNYVWTCEEMNKFSKD